MKLLKPQQIAEALSISQASAYRLLESGALPSVTIFAGQRKKTLRVRQEVLERWVMQREKSVGTIMQPRKNRSPAIDSDCSPIAHAKNDAPLSH